MKANDTQKYGAFLKKLPTRHLDGLLSLVLREMRRRESNHLKSDAITTSQTLRSLRLSGKLP
jgi:hypothetical protein